MNITEHQKQIMKHAISGPGRNWFGTSPDSDDGQAFEKLVAGGLATKEKGPSWMGGETIYSLTDEGRSVAINHEISNKPV